jgi:hypothetical protein
MNRYNSARPMPDSNGKRRLTTTIFPTIPPDATDVFIRTTSMERLDKLAHTFYGDATAWPILASINGLGKGTIIVPPNTRLRIPNIQNVQQYFDNTSNIR